MAWGTAALATVYTTAYFVVLAICLAHSDIIKENQILLVLITFLTVTEGQIVGYFFGSSQGSKNNADRFADLATSIAQKPNPSPAVVDAIKTAAKKK